MLETMLLKKLQVKYSRLFLSATLCGLIIGVFSVFSFIMGNLSDNALLNKIAYSAAFTSVLFVVILNKYDLFTGNTMCLILLKGQKVKPSNILTNMSIIYVGNFLGCFLTAALLSHLGVTEKLYVHDVLINVFAIKTGYSILELLVLGVLANFFVCMAVFNAAKGENLAQSYLNLFFPIFIFCLLGFEHSVANMFSLSIKVLEDSSYLGLMMYNLFFVTIGNILGGVLFALSSKIKE